MNDDLSNWDFASHHIAGRLVNISTDNGDRYFTARPVTEIADTGLGIVYDIDLSEGFHHSSTPVTLSLLESWNVPIQDLEKAAMKNMPSLRPATLCPIDRLPNTCELLRIIRGFPVVPTSVVTNERNHYGAICIIYPGIYEEVCKQFQEDCYILPSSVHECLCVPKSCTTLETLYSMLAWINQQKIHSEEILCSDIFEMQDGKLVLAMQRSGSILDGPDDLPFY